jgi:hypothetical protein
MKIVYNQIIIIASLLFSIPCMSHAGFFTNLLGLGSYEDCMKDGLETAKTSREIKKVNDSCKQDYPDAGTINSSSSDKMKVPLVIVPAVPLAVTPLIPVVPTPIK